MSSFFARCLENVVGLPWRKTIRIALAAPMNAFQRFGEDGHQLVMGTHDDARAVELMRVSPEGYRGCALLRAGEDRRSGLVKEHEPAGRVPPPDDELSATRGTHLVEDGPATSAAAVAFDVRLRIHGTAAPIRREQQSPWRLLGSHLVRPRDEEPYQFAALVNEQRARARVDGCVDAAPVVTAAGAPVVTHEIETTS